MATINTTNTAPTFTPPTGTGKLLVPVGDSYDNAYGVILQPDGKIVVAGSSSDNDFSLIRLNADGSLDTSFGGQGTGKLIGGARVNRHSSW
ncbi:delta-60 repeat domain-containing protein [Delftia sp. PS-11]|uniref:delta-60 repeat domain-containing protein n=1 Tax=Delftia sp. PS-11 TaxID=2767222 RepID=UPI003AB337DF